MEPFFLDDWRPCIQSHRSFKTCSSTTPSFGDGLSLTYHAASSLPYLLKNRIYPWWLGAGQDTNTSPFPTSETNLAKCFGFSENTYLLMMGICHEYNDLSVLFCYAKLELSSVWGSHVLSRNWLVLSCLTPPGDKSWQDTYMYIFVRVDI